MRVFWHREDLRATDNRGLMQAAQDAAEADEHLLPVFIFDSLTTDHDGNPRMQYLLDSLAELRQWYRNHGGDIYVTVGNAVDTFEQLLTTYDISGVYWNRLYNKEARARDEQVTETIKAAQIDVETVRDELFFEPGDITTNKGEPYSVYTYFWKKWRDRPKETRVAHPPAPVLAKEEGETIPSMEDIGFSPPQADIQPAGMDAATERLETFCDDGIFRYESDRDYPAREGVSRLSADLSAGTIGVRTVHDATVEAKERASEEETDSVEEYQSQLAWREFYTHVLYFNPDVETENYKSYENPINWRDNPEELAAWKQGKTGYPIVDAGMRQLLEEAYMHNRMRMIVASFLTKDLQIDWREGYAHFRKYLADHNIANNNGGWQWAASTGTDSQPYFRIFNPMTQGERYDPDAKYIKQYVPELEGVSPDIIHSWHECSLSERARCAPDYPAPIVDHSHRREATLDMFQSARGDD